MNVDLPTAVKLSVDHDHRTCSCDYCIAVRRLLIQQCRGRLTEAWAEKTCALCDRHDLALLMKTEGSVILCAACSSRAL